jgi:glycosyltransferase involved in cell wall biosynthesis
VVIPTFNEVGNIAAMIYAVMKAVPSGSILVVDDGSPDGTADLVQAQAASYGDGRVQVLRRCMVEVPIQFGERTRGDSKMSALIVLEALWLVTRSAVRPPVLTRAAPIN